MPAPSKNRFLRLLRRTAASAQRTGTRASAADQNALWLAHERAMTSTRAVAEAAQRVASSCAKQRGGLVGRLEEARNPGAEASGEAARAQAASSEAERALGDVQNRLRKATGSDPEIVHAVTEAAEHARALVASLGTLTGRVPRSLLL